MIEMLNKVTCGNCLDLMRELPDGCCSLAVVDGPYNMRKADWDKFDTWEDFRRFYVPVFNELSRVLRDNCSMYVFGTFEGLAALKPALDDLGGGWGYRQAITWTKPGYRYSNEIGRMFPVTSEYILYYARERVDISSLAWDGVTREDNTIREYLNAERELAGVTRLECNLAFSEYTNKTGCRDRSVIEHYWQNSQWILPTKEIYENVLRPVFNSHEGGPYLRREYEDLLEEYESIKREYRLQRKELEDLRYVFNPQKGVTDVWDAPICAGKERLKVDGKTAHVAQKPLSIIERIITSSSNEGDTVIDPFAGTGTTGVACKNLNRNFIGFELSQEYVDIANARIEHHAKQEDLCLSI